MCSDHEKVHSPCKGICPLEKISEPGDLSWAERLQGEVVCEFLRKWLVSLFPLLLLVCLFLGEREFVANVRALKTLL